MNATMILNRAEELREELIENRRTLHSYAETGFDLPQTTAFVEKKLREYGLTPVRCGKTGITCVIGDPKKGKCFLLRGDMDALPMTEESGLPFAAQNGHCHSCGHDTHTAMLLAAARLLSEHAGELPGCVKLMFQPAEELLAGAKDMIEHGLLENPRVDAGIGLHISVGGGEDTAAGKISYKPGVANFSGDAIRVTFTGKDAHGSTPQKGVDAINIAAHAVIALQEILAREVAMDDRTMVLVGTIHGGSSCNTLSGSCAVEISVRAADREMRAFLKERVKEICEGTAATFRGKAEVEFVYGMPSLYNDPAVCEAVSGYCAELFGAGDVIELTGLSGTEDFTAVAEQIPAAMFHLGVGSIAEGHTCGAHNPKMIVDESVLYRGAALYAYCAARYLDEHRD